MNKKTKKVSEDSPIDVSYDSWENREMFLKVVFLIKKGVRRVDMSILTRSPYHAAVMQNIICCPVPRSCPLKIFDVFFMRIEFVRITRLKIGQQ